MPEEELHLAKLAIGIVLNVATNEDPLPEAMTEGLMGTLTDMPLGVKAGLKLTLEREKHAPPDVVTKALRSLAEGDILLLEKLALKAWAETEEAMDELIADLEQLLADRPVGVDVDFKRISEGSFRRGDFKRRMSRRTPMDALLGQAGRMGFDRVEVRIGGEGT